MGPDLVDSMKKKSAYDGEPARVFVLTNQNGMSITLMDIGATWLSCKLPIDGKLKEVLLGVSTLEDFEKHTTYMGSTIGRFANRIAGGRFTIDGQLYQTKVNLGVNTLHGGQEGFNRRRWDAIELDNNSVMFALISPDGDQGFPGELRTTVTYRLTQNNEVVIRYNASSNKPTPVNLTNHAYFNFEDADSGSDSREHKLRIKADYYLPVDADGIPKGEYATVYSTNFDFNAMKTISSRFLKDQEQIESRGYDHSFIFDPRRKKSEPVAWLSNSDESITLEIRTDKPALQFYTGNWNAGTPRRIGGTYENYSGVALETQYLPDAPNHPEWVHPDSILRPGQIYQSKTSYKFIF